MSTLYLAAELSLACFVGMVVAVVTVSAVEAKRIEKQYPEPLPERMPQREPIPVFAFAPYAYLRCYSDGEATWQLHSGQQIYHVN